MDAGTFDEQDDLGGVLAADSPLLARAFRGTDRPPLRPCGRRSRPAIDGADPTQVFEQVASLERYPAWLRMVHRVEPDGADDRPAGMARRVAGTGRPARRGRSGCGWCARSSSPSAT